MANDSEAQKTPEDQTLPPLWCTRIDGTRYPNSQAEEAILAMRTLEGADTGPGFEWNCTLGDLLEEAFSPERADGESLEYAFMRATARELRACLVAASNGSTGGNLPVVRFSEGDLLHALDVIVRRMEAGAELIKRLSAARGAALNDDDGSFRGAQASAFRMTIARQDESG